MLKFKNKFSIIKMNNVSADTFDKHKEYTNGKNIHLNLQ